MNELLILWQKLGQNLQIKIEFKSEFKKYKNSKLAIPVLPTRSNIPWNILALILERISP